MKETLRSQYKFIEAVDGVEAIEILRLRKDEIHLVLLDMIMPQMDGYQVMKVATEENLVENIPVVAVTSEEGEESYVRMLELGIREVVKKPFSPLVVQGKFKNLIDLYRYDKKPEIVTPPVKKIREEKSIPFSTGVFHLKFVQEWECIFVSDSCLELLKCNRKEFLTILSHWEVEKRDESEKKYIRNILQELGKEPGSSFYIGNIYDENKKDYQKIKVFFDSFWGEDGKIHLYGTMMEEAQSGALIYYEPILEKKEQQDLKSYNRSSMALMAMKHFYEIASVNLRVLAILFKIIW